MRPVIQIYQKILGVSKKLKSALLVTEWKPLHLYSDRRLTLDVQEEKDHGPNDCLRQADVHLQNKQEKTHTTAKRTEITGYI